MNLGGTSSSKGQLMATAEDQQRINKFARLHKISQAIKTEIKAVQIGDRDLQDASEEVELLDEKDAISIPNQLGSIFIHYDQETTVAKLAERRAQVQKRIDRLTEKKAEIDVELRQLKKSLYDKFGENIHLEMDSEEESK